MKKLITFALATIMALSACPATAFAADEYTDIGTAISMSKDSGTYPVTADFWVRGRDTDVHYDVDLNVEFSIDKTGKVTYTVAAADDFEYVANVYCHTEVKTNIINVTYDAPEWCAYGKFLDAENRNGWHMLDTNCTYKYGHGDAKPVETYWYTVFDLKPDETFTVAKGDVIGVWSMSPATPVREDENGNLITKNYDQTERNINGDTVNVTVENDLSTMTVFAELGNATEVVEKVYDDNGKTYSKPVLTVANIANYTLGDVNLDSIVSVSDLILMRKHIDFGEDINTAVADMNTDGTVNNTDFDMLVSTLVDR